uniref:Uncharacterized protein n=1 Tax=Glossina palpalis gambiensis TaxID=67801 RepID=A0A1B0BTB8_9MUSC
MEPSGLSGVIRLSMVQIMMLMFGCYAELKPPVKWRYGYGDYDEQKTMNVAECWRQVAFWPYTALAACRTEVFQAAAKYFLEGTAIFCLFHGYWLMLVLRGVAFSYRKQLIDSCGTYSSLMIFFQFTQVAADTLLNVT